MQNREIGDVGRLGEVYRTRDLNLEREVAFLEKYFGPVER